MQYRVKKTLELFAGEITLSANQALPRLKDLKAVKVNKKGAGIYEIISSVQFKAGEIIDIKARDKATMVKLEEVNGK
jgi:hypothetical protein